ncbi:Uncharacterised protein [Sporosarcina pasteurii]|uniref:Uncharacterized protein n=1 Tax=Sporosarcina pasteurii TaxID=1474 RepID=A0A380C8A0_SPOPA|nr:Uncharacterised protein [Sporosarcina pasteurii]
MILYNKTTFHQLQASMRVGVWKVVLFIMNLFFYNEISIIQAAKITIIAAGTTNLTRNFQVV